MAKLPGKTKQWYKKHETYQFCTREHPNRDSLGIINALLKTEKSVTFTSFGMATITWNFKKSNEQILWNFCIFTFLGPKMFHSLKIQSLLLIFNACHHVQFQKNLMNRFSKNFKSIYPIWPNYKFSSKFQNSQYALMTAIRYNITKN